MFVHVHKAKHFVSFSCVFISVLTEYHRIEHFFPLGLEKKMKKSLQTKAVLICVVVVVVVLSQGVEVLKQGETDLRSLGIKTGCEAERWTAGLETTC